MLIALIIWGCFILIGLWMLLTAPEGYEDETGFHLGRKEDKEK